MKAGFVALGLGYYMEDYLVDELYESTHKLPQQDLKCNSLMNHSRSHNPNFVSNQLREKKFGVENSSGVLIEKIV
jgi:hypothetical protein